MPAVPTFFRDPRHGQIAVLAALVLWAAFGLDLEIRPAVVVVILATALPFQWLLGRLVGLPRFEPRSALISSLSLTLLLRTGGSLPLAALAAALTIGSKFAIRFDGKHLFNPTAFGIVATMIVSGGRAWISPGQWGSAVLLGFFLVGAGSLVVRRAERSDVTWAFLASYAAIVVGRAVWLGDPLPIPLHQLSSGTLLVFAFFMISDPRTTPDSRAGRIVFAILVASGAGFVRFGLHRPNGLVFALVAVSILTPLLDRLLRGRRHAWPDHPLTAWKGAHHEPTSSPA